MGMKKHLHLIAYHDVTQTGFARGLQKDKKLLIIFLASLSTADHVSSIVKNIQCTVLNFLRLYHNYV